MKRRPGNLPFHIYFNSRIYQFHVLIAMVNCHHLLFQMCHPDRHSRRSPRGSCRGWALLPPLLHPLPHEWVVDKFSATFKFSLQFQPTVPGLRCPQAAISSFKIRRLNKLTSSKLHKCKGFLKPTTLLDNQQVTDYCPSRTGAKPKISVSSEGVVLLSLQVIIK